MELSIQSEVKFGTEICCRCGVHFAMPATLQQSFRNNHEWFYCPNGHEQHYTGKTEAEKLREELKRKEQELANKVIEKITVENELLRTQKQLKRVHKGTCPCCKRSFQNLKQHMATKHPEHPELVK